MDANTILRSCTGDFCRIEVTPSSALNINIESTQNRGFQKKTNIFFY